MTLLCGSQKERNFVLLCFMPLWKEKTNHLNQQKSVTPIPLKSQVKSTALSINPSLDCPAKAREAIQSERVRLLEEHFVTEAKKGRSGAIELKQ